eukprot:8722943-Karenia_brevis.AAC.1
MSMHCVSSSAMLGSIGRSLLVLDSCNFCFPTNLCDGLIPLLPAAVKMPGTSADVGGIADASEEKDKL